MPVRLLRNKMINGKKVKSDIYNIYVSKPEVGEKVTI